MHTEKFTKEIIDAMTHEEMAWAWRFNEAGHPFFSDPELAPYFEKRFKQLGGMTAEISKKIGWNKDE